MKPLRVLIGYSRDPVTVTQMRGMGIEAWTCDLLPADHEWHIQDDIWNVLTRDWAFAILHPMCTYLTVSAAWAYGDGPYHQKVAATTLVGSARRAAREEALANFRRLLALPFPKAVENPAKSFVCKAIRPPDQTIHPFQFGDDASKATGLWLDGAPRLRHTAYVPPRVVNGLPRWSNQTDGGQNKLTPSNTRWLERSATYPGIAHAFAEQWGQWLLGRSPSGDVVL